MPDLRVEWAVSELSDAAFRTIRNSNTPKNKNSERTVVLLDAGKNVAQQQAQQTANFRIESERVRGVLSGCRVAFEFEFSSSG